MWSPQKSEELVWNKVGIVKKQKEGQCTWSAFEKAENGRRVDWKERILILFWIWGKAIGGFPAEEQQNKIYIYKFVF